MAFSHRLVLHHVLGLYQGMFEDRCIGLVPIEEISHTFRYYWSI